MQEVFTQDHINQYRLYSSVTKMVDGYKIQARKQGVNPPDFDAKDLMNWMYSQANFSSLYLHWLNNNFEKTLRLKMRIKEERQDKYTLNNFILSNQETEYNLYLSQVQALANEQGI